MQILNSVSFRWVDPDVVSLLSIAGRFPGRLGGGQDDPIKTGGAGEERLSCVSSASFRLVRTDRGISGWPVVEEVEDRPRRSREISLVFKRWAWPLMSGCFKKFGKSLMMNLSVKTRMLRREENQTFLLSIAQSKRQKSPDSPITNERVAKVQTAIT